MPLITKPTGMSKIWALSGVKETPADSKIAQGWVVELPPYQYDNWLSNRQDTYNAHANQLGIPQWDAVTEYQGGKSYTSGIDGVIYKALVTNTNVVPSNPLNSSVWVKAFEDFGVVAALTASFNAHLVNYSTLASISNYPAARTNLNVYSKTESDVRFAAVAGNISNTFHVANATLDTQAINRGQFLSLLSQATEVSTGVSAIATQTEANVGTNDTKFITPLKGKTTYLMRSNNLSDVASIATAKTNLGIKDVGTTAGTIAAGDDSRIVNATPNSRVITAGSGLTGGGDLIANRTITLGVPASLTLTTTNSVSSESHTHAVDVLSLQGVAANTLAAGNDSRIVNAVPNTRTLLAGIGLTGGGTLAANQTIQLGVPTTLTLTATNTVTADSHSHAISVVSLQGTTASTLAAGDDSRIVNAVPNTRTFLAGNGLTGGGGLSANQTIQLGAPSSIGFTTTNTVSATSHTHNVDVTSFQGTTSDKLMAGNDSRVLNAVPNTRSVVAGDGLTGGGSLLTDRTVTLGTPSSLSVGSVNTVSSTSHTHAVDITSFFANRSFTDNGWYVLPGGLCVQWGTTAQDGGTNESRSHVFPLAFSNCLHVTVGTVGTASGVGAQKVAHFLSKSNTGFNWYSDAWDSNSVKIAATYIAIGLV
jgi:hypothetical protein